MVSDVFATPIAFQKELKPKLDCVVLMTQEEGQLRLLQEQLVAVAPTAAAVCRDVLSDRSDTLSDMSDSSRQVTFTCRRSYSLPAHQLEGADNIHAPLRNGTRLLPGHS